MDVIKQIDYMIACLEMAKGYYGKWEIEKGKGERL